MNKIDYKILDLLQDNGRISYHDLGKKVGITRQAVTRRVKKMVDTGYIRKFSVDLDHERLGRKVVAYVDIIFNKAFTVEVEKVALDFITKINGVRLANTTVGEKYITIKIYTLNMQDLHHTIRTIQNGIQDISTKTVIVNENFFTNKIITYSIN